MDLNNKMFKSKLSVFCQQGGFPTPIYLVGDPEGPPHTPVFKECTVTIGENDYKFSITSGSKKELENLAAEETLKILEDNVIAKTKKCVERSAKTKKKYDKVYLVDFDNSADVDIKNLSGEIHLFVAQTFNLKTKKMKGLQKRDNLEIHQAQEPLPEIVDHMMTWYACENLKKIRDKEVIIVSRDSGLYALVSLLKQKQVNAKMVS